MIMEGKRCSKIAQQAAEDSKTLMWNVGHSYLSNWCVAINGGKSNADHHHPWHLGGGWGGNEGKQQKKSWIKRLWMRVADCLLAFSEGGSL